MRTRFILGVCVALLPVSFVCTGLAEDTNAATELHLRGLEAQWSKTAGAKDLDKMVSFYADGAMVLPPNAPSATTKEAIRKVWKDLFETPGSAVSFKPSKVEVAQSGDIAYSSGTYDVTMKNASGKPVSDQGKYVAVWKKQADGKWKCVADIWNSDLPAAAPSEKK